MCLNSKILTWSQAKKGVIAADIRPDAPTLDCQTLRSRDQLRLHRLHNRLLHPVDASEVQHDGYGLWVSDKFLRHLLNDRMAAIVGVFLQLRGRFLLELRRCV